MKLVSYRLKGKDSYGVVVDDGVVDLGKKLGKKAPTLRAALEAKLLPAIKKIAASARKTDAPLNKIEFLPVIPNPDKVVCIGLNYATHIKETGRDMPAYPMLFSRYPNAQVGQNQPLIRPKASEKFDFEGELAVVIGRRCRHVSKDKALSVVAGYSCFNDGSIRDWQRHTAQYMPGKNFFKSGSFGPWLVTTDEIRDPSKLTVETRLNGQVMQHATTDDLVFDVKACIEYISAFTELYPGDVISTGTTGGVGAFRNPPVWMKPGDVIEVDITKIGVLRNTIKDEK
jgi:2-keto-4-pentenoate hydratase/2-oxohepta-3-ene-1,7-dioic acid hydratase in catechol pathway